MPNADIIIYTDDDGVGKVENLVEGRYHVLAEKDGYLPFSANHNFTVENPDIDITFHEKPPVVPEATLTVLDGSTDDPVPGVVVTLTDDDDNDYIELTDENGVATFIDLPQGMYDITTSKEGYVPYTGRITYTIAHPDHELSITPIPSEKVDIKINVGNITGAPLPAAVVTIDNELITPLSETTDVFGECTFENMDPGTYNVIVSKAGYHEYNGSKLFTIDDDTLTINMYYSIENISITIKNSLDQSALPGASVELTHNPTGEVTTKTTTSSGVASFDDMAEGQYTVKMTCDKFQSRTRSLNFTTESHTWEETLERIPQRIENVYVNVTDDEYAPIENAMVQIFSTGGLWKTRMTDADGVATFNQVIDEGTHTINVSKTGYEQHQQQYMLTETNYTVDVSLEEEEIDYIDIDLGVTDHSTSDPLSGVSITLEPETGDPLTGTTGSDGHLVFEDALPGRYHITAELENYYSFYIYNTFTVTEPSYDFEMEELPKIPLIQVTIKDEDTESPIEGVNVALTKGDVSVNDDTNASGIAAFNNLYAGDYAVVCTKIGYGTISTTHEFTTASPNVTYNMSAGNINIDIGVKNIAGNNLPGVYVTLSNDDITTPVSGLTDETGHVVFSDMPQGTYDATAELDDYETYTGSLSFSSESTTATIVLEPDLPVIDQIHVTVRDAEETLVEGATVTFSNTSLLPEPIVRTTGSAGGCNFNNIKVGTYDVTCTKTGWDDYDRSITFNEGDTSLDIMLSYPDRPIKAMFEVADESGDKISGATIVFDGYTKTTNSIGQAFIWVEEKTNYSLQVTKVGYKPVTQTVPITDVQSGTIDITMEEAEGSELEVTVLDFDSAQPVPGATVAIAGHELVTGSDGKCVFTLVPITGDYTAFVFEPHHEDGEATITPEILESGATSIDIQRATVDRVQFHVLDSGDGAPVTLASVTIESDSEEAETKTTSVEGGTATFFTKLSDVYNVTITHSNYKTITTTRDITDSTKEFTIEMNPLSTVVINVDGSDVSLIDGATVKLEQDGETKYQGVTVGGGHCTLANVEFGTYSLVVSATHYETHTEALIVDHLEESVDVTLQRSDLGTVHITVRDEDYDYGISGASVTLDKVGSTPVTRQTDSFGVATFTNITADHYQLLVEAINYHSNSSTIDIDDTHTEFTVEMEATIISKIMVTAKNSVNQPIGSALVKLQCNRLGEEVTAYTDSEGLAQFPNMPTDNYTITILKEGYITSVTTNTFTDNQPAKTITLQDDTIPEVTVKCTNDSGEAVSSVEVTLDDTERVVPHTAFTNSQGIATFTNLRPLTYELTCEHDDYTTYEDEVSLTKTDHHVDVTLIQDRLPEVNVYVKTQQGAAIPNATVVLDGETTTPISKTSDTNGKATFTYMKIEDYDMQVSCTGYETYNAEVTLDPQHTTFNVALAVDSFTITITAVEDDNDLGIPNMVVTIQKQGGTSQSKETNNDGVATFTNQTTGSYSVSIDRQSHDYTPISTTVSFSKASNSYEASMTRVRSPFVYIYVQKPNRERLQGAQVKLVDHHGGEIKQGVSDTNGVVELTNVKDGAKDITVDLYGYAPYFDVTSFRKGYLTDYTAELTAASLTTSSIHLKREKDAADVYGAEVEMKSNSDPTKKVTGTTNQFGNVDLSTYPGSFTITASDSSYNDKIITRTISPGGNNIEMEMTVKTRSLSGARVYAVDSSTDEDLVGAGVKLTNQRTGEVITKVTGSSGYAQFDNIETGWFTAVLEADYHDTKTVENMLFLVTKTANTVHLDPEKTSIKINVREEIYQSPVEGAKVTLTPPVGVATVQFTNSSGHVEWPNQNSGTYGVKIEAAGYATFEDDVNFYVGHDTDTVDLERGNIDVQYVYMTNAETGAICSGSVTLEDAITGETFTEIAGTGEGKATFNNILGGQYHITATSYMMEDYDGGVVFINGEDIHIELNPLAVCTIGLYSKTPPPSEVVKSCDYVLDDGVHEPITGTTSSRSGYAKIEGVPKGRYHVTVSKTGYTTYDEYHDCTEATVTINAYLSPV